MSRRAAQPDLFSTGDQLGLQIAGIDEAGRGPLAGPVYAAAVILEPGSRIVGLNDSKKLTASHREALSLVIRERAVAYCIASASVEEIDTLNILQATMLAMRRACEGLAVQPDKALIDGNRVPQGLTCVAEPVIGGDAMVAAIAAASILAKTARDADCMSLHLQYPEYSFDQHKGYGTRMHLERLHANGPCPAHRRSFAPVRRLLDLAAGS